MKMGVEHQEEAAAAAAAAVSNTTQDSSAVASSNLFMMTKNDELDGMGEAAAPQFYYYQNPTTGTVSQTPLAVAQLVRLLVPVREGMKAILPPHTQCLAVGNAANTPTKRMEEEDEEGDEGEATTTAASFGEWKPVSTVNVLKEAACAQWYLTGWPTQSSENGKGESSKAEEEAVSPAPALAGTQGPMTCRSLLDAYHQVTDQSKVLVFAPEITSEWTPIDKLPRLQLVLQALQPMPPPPPSFHSLPDASSDSVAQNDEHIRNDDDNDDDVAASATIQDELEAFLSSTAAGGGGGANGNDDEDDDDDDDQAYESDGGTRYVKDPLSGHWIHEALAPPRPEPKNSSKQSSSQNKKSTTANNNKNPSSKKSHKKAKFSKRNARNWIYVTGLPTTPGHVDVAQVHKFFGKVGLLDLDPETLQPKLKLYKSSDGNGSLKGDASLCYARPESVELALQVLDESPWDEHHTIRIQRAKFEAKTEDDENDDDDDDEKDAQTTTTTKKKKRGDKRKRERKTISQAQRKVARLALLQAQDEGFGERLAGGRKGLRIVVVKHMLDGIPEPDWESTIQDYCQSLEEDVTVEKITCISKTKVVIVKFVEPSGASQAVEAWNGKVNTKSSSLGQGANKTKSMEAFYWDGVTDYTDSHEEHNPDEEAKRHEDFGKWLDDQGESELPPELRLQVAEG